MGEREEIREYLSNLRKSYNDIMMLEHIVAKPLEYIKRLHADLGPSRFDSLVEIRWGFDNYGWEDTAKEFEDMLKQRIIVAAKKRLNDLLNKNIIFPKYRDFVAVNQMAEYFDSGRCYSLEGPDGAYNLYESECRQNYIISRLDVIVNQLEQIKQNQYYIYTAIQECTNAAQNAVPIINVYVN